MTNKSSFLVIMISVINLTLGLSQESKFYDLRRIDSISSFFHQREIEELIALDNYFISTILKDTVNVDIAYKEYLQSLINKINEVETFNSCELTELVVLAKQDLKRKLGPLTYTRIFRPDLARYYLESDTLFVYYDEINTCGKYIDFLSYYAKTDTLFKGYVETIKLTGDFPMFLDCLEIYVEKLDFDNQIHRLIVLFHLMSRSSLWIYDDCLECTKHNNVYSK
mgnify:CR=1 FL=1|jgi:hypothetical protein